PFHARIALARMGHDRARKEILAELGSPRREVLSGAVVSAGRARMKEARDVIAKLTAAAVGRDLVREARKRIDAGEDREGGAAPPRVVAGEDRAAAKGP